MDNVRRKQPIALRENLRPSGNIERQTESIARRLQLPTEVSLIESSPDMDFS